MAKLHLPSGTGVFARARQRGLTLIEFMVSIAIGMILVAALATLIADQSGNRAEVDRAGRLIENGRYAIRTLADDLQMAGYWGELTSTPAGLGAWQDPCGAAPAAPTRDEMVAWMGMHITGFEVPINPARAGYNDATPLTAGLACLSNLKPGTDVVVLRYAAADSSPYETAAGVPDPAKLTSATAPNNNSTRLFIQTGLNAANNIFTWKAATGANQATMDLVRKDKVTKATVRRMVVRMYYVTTCSVCTGANADSLPSLKMKELVEGPAWSDAVTIAEGIENLQIEYGVDSAAAMDGAPDGADVQARNVAVGAWPTIVSAKLYVVSRSTEVAPSPYSDTKTYPLGLAGAMTPTGDELRYKRHVFVQTVRLVNPSFRRSL